MQPKRDKLPVILGIQGAGGVPAVPWWGRFVTDAEQFRTMAVEIERVKGAQTAHERECAQRYERINEHQVALTRDLSDIKTGQSRLESQLNKLTVDGATQKVSTDGLVEKIKNWVLVAVLGAVLGLSGWEAQQLYQIQTSRIDAVQKH